MGINLWGVIYGCHVFAPLLKQQGRGGIINVASSASFAAAPLMGPYNVTKAGVLALSETLAAETAGTGVNVTVLCPTVVNTNIFSAGRIHGGVPPVLNRIIELTGVSAEGVADTTLKALARGQLHVLPQFDARMIWRAKRLLPATYTRGAGLLNRLAAKLNLSPCAGRNASWLPSTSTKCLPKSRAPNGQTLTGMPRAERYRRAVAKTERVHGRSDVD